MNVTAHVVVVAEVIVGLDATDGHAEAQGVASFNVTPW